MRNFLISIYILIFTITQCVKQAKSYDYTTSTITTTLNPTEECIEKFHVPRGLVERFKIGNFKTSDKSLKKWVFCYLIKNGVMSNEGVLRQDVILKDIPSEDKARIEKLINKCLYKKRHILVDIAWKYLTCFRAKEPVYSRVAHKI